MKTSSGPAARSLMLSLAATLFLAVDPSAWAQTVDNVPVLPGEAVDSGIDTQGIDSNDLSDDGLDTSVTTEGITTEGITTEGMTTEGITSGGETSEGITTEGMTSEGVTTEGLTNEGIEVAPQEIAPEIVATPAPGTPDPTIVPPPATPAEEVPEASTEVDVGGASPITIRRPSSSVVDPSMAELISTPNETSANPEDPSVRIEVAPPAQPANN